MLRQIFVCEARESKEQQHRNPQTLDSLASIRCPSSCSKAHSRGREGWPSPLSIRSP